MTRLPDWRVRLVRTLDDVATKPFDWGDTDCVFGLAAPAVEAVTGEKMVEEFRGTYSTAAGAVRALLNHGYADLPDYLAQHFVERPPALARVGDLVLIRADETGWGIGVVLGDRVAVMTPTGYGTVTRDRAERAFEVG